MFRGTWEPFLYYSKSGKYCFIIYITSFEISILAFKTQQRQRQYGNKHIQGFKIKFWWNEKWVLGKSLPTYNVVFMKQFISIINLSCCTIWILKRICFWFCKDRKLYDLTVQNKYLNKESWMMYWTIISYVG